MDFSTLKSIQAQSTRREIAPSPAGREIRSLTLLSRAKNRLKYTTQSSTQSSAQRAELRKRVARCLWLAFVCLCGPGALHADAPQIDRLFPPGGQLGTTVDVKFSGKPGKGALRTWTASNELQVNVSEERDSAKITIPKLATPGIHWLRLYNEHGATELLPFVVGLIEEAAETEPNDTIEESQPVDAAAVTINGVLQKTGDVDAYSIDLQQGQTLVASVDAHRSLASPVDTVIQILNAAGTVVAHNDDDHGLDPQIVFPVTEAGRYHVRVFGFPATPDKNIRLAGAASYVYRLTVTTGAFVDHTEPLSLAPDQAGEVKLYGWNLESNTRSADRPMLTPDDDANESPFVVSLNTALPAFVPVALYSVSTEQTARDQPLSLPFSLTGHISEPDERDVFTFTGSKRQSITLAVRARSYWSLLDPVLTVIRPGGKVFKEYDDRSREDLDIETTIKLPDDGTYSVAITDRYSDGGDRYFYELTVSEPKPEFRIDSDKTAFTFAAKEPLAIPIRIDRRNGFSDSIDFAVRGLPDGIEFQTGASHPKGDTSKTVKITLHRQSEKPWSGNIRIVGLSEDSRSTASLWLTVPPVP